MRFDLAVPANFCLGIKYARYYRLKQARQRKVFGLAMRNSPV
jgi:hypothetical protein